MSQVPAFMSSAREISRVPAPLATPLPAAHAGSRRRAAARGGSASLRLLVFRAGSERFATGLADVDRVARRAEPRRIPDAAPWIEGAAAHGDALLPIVDLRVRLGLVPGAWGERARTLIVPHPAGAFGVAVDEVLDVAAVEPAELRAAEGAVRGLPAAYLRGLVRLDGEVVLVLDLARLVEREERLALAARLDDATPGGAGV